MKGFKMEYFDFRKTLSRNEYWPRFIFLLFLGVLGYYAEVVLQTPLTATYIAGIIKIISSLFVAVALFFMVAQRSNDLNASPWLSLSTIVTLGLFFMIVHYYNDLIESPWQDLLTIVPVLNIVLFLTMGAIPKRD